jgi:hypothetical protein
VIALLLRDIRLAMRAGGGFGLGLSFFLIVVVLVPFGVGPQSALLTVIAPGILWLGALLACLLSLDRILALDWEDGSLDLLATSPLPMDITFSGNAGPQRDRHIRCGADRWAQAWGAVAQPACAAALCAYIDLWGRGGAARSGRV